MKKIYLILILILATLVGGCLSDSPTTGSLSGTVVDHEGEYIKGTTISINDKSTTTNDNGAYEIEKIETGSYTLEANKKDYITKETYISISEGDNIIDQIILRRKDLKPEEPVIKNVNLETEQVSDGTELHLTIKVESNIPVNRARFDLYGPNGHISGMYARNLQEINPSIWKDTYVYKIGHYAPNGEYYYYNILVENEANLESEVWPQKVSVEIK